MSAKYGNIFTLFEIHDLNQIVMVFFINLQIKLKIIMGVTALTSGN